MQVLYNTPTRVHPRYSPSTMGYLVQNSDLPFFIDSEWPLDSAIAAPDTHILRFVVYVPPLGQCPLHLEGAPMSAFTVPAWGALMVWNPPTCLATDPAKAEELPQEEGYAATQNSRGNPQTGTVSDAELGRIMRTVAAQLRKLFGLPAQPPHGTQVTGKAVFGWPPKNGLLNRKAVFGWQ